MFLINSTPNFEYKFVLVQALSFVPLKPFGKKGWCRCLDLELDILGYVQDKFSLKVYSRISRGGGLTLWRRGGGSNWPPPQLIFYITPTEEIVISSNFVAFPNCLLMSRPPKKILIFAFVFEDGEWDIKKYQN